MSTPDRIALDGAFALLIDRERGIVAIDGISGGWGIFDGPEWRLIDLRDGMYGDFHRLRPAAECSLADCVASGQHNFAAPWWKGVAQACGIPLGDGYPDCLAPRGHNQHVDGLGHIFDGYELVQRYPGWRPS